MCYGENQFVSNKMGSEMMKDATKVKWETRQTDKETGRQEASICECVYVPQ